MIEDSLLKSLPEEPGIYKFYNEEKSIIYVGKAKNLKKRVNSYFGSNKNKDRKTRRLVSQIEDVQFSVVLRESEALLLENNLIKQHQPKYNVLLKDGKTYPYIVITKERFPRIFHTRRKDDKRGEYFGPYPSVRIQKEVIELLQKLFKFRTCKLSLSKKNIEAGKFKVCLEYHLGNCFGPCEELYDEESYMQDVDLARKVLKGQIKIVKEHFLKKIEKYAESLEFEKAQRFKTALEALEKYHSKSLVANVHNREIHVLSITHGLRKIFGNYIYLHEGAIIKTRNVELKNPLELSDQELFKIFLNDVQNDSEVEINEVISNISLESEKLEIAIKNPKSGELKRILDLSLKNAIEYKNSIEQVDMPDPNLRKLETLKEELNLDVLPDHIECFDNSNIQGHNPVASMVCFKNGKPSKKDYRHFNIKTVIGPNDFDSMHEIVNRRYKRLKEENASFPKLIIIDGGKGQLSSAYAALNELDLEIPIIGIAKRLEEVYKPGDSFPLMISKKSEGLKLIQHLRNEAHRFAITHHRNQRSKTSAKSELDTIKGIGPKTKSDLLKRFKSWKKIKESSEAELIDLIGQAKASIILEHIKKAGN